MTTANPVFGIDRWREDLEKHLPKVCYFPLAFRSRQENYLRLLFNPVLLKYNYTKVNDFIWYLPDAK